MSENSNSSQLPRASLPRFWFVVPLAIVIVCVGGLSLLRVQREPEWSLGQVAEAAKQEQITRIDVSSSSRLTISLRDGRTVYSTKDPGGSVFEQLSTLGASPDELAQIQLTNSEDWDTVRVTLMYVAPLVVFVGTIVWLLSRVVKYDPKG